MLTGISGSKISRSAATTPSYSTPPGSPVFLGNELIKRVPLATVRVIAALLFLAIGLWLLLQTMGIL